MLHYFAILYGILLQFSKVNSFHQFTKHSNVPKSVSTGNAFTTRKGGTENRINSFHVVNPRSTLPGSYLGAISVENNASEENRNNDLNGNFQNPLVRATYIASVLLLQTALPLLISAIQTKAWKTPTKANNVSSENISYNGDDLSRLDLFWSYQASIASNELVTNSDLVAKSLENLGPTFVKFGQAAASRGDLISVPLATSLSTLQDRMQPFDSNIAKRMIQSDLSKKVSHDGTKLSETKIISLIESLSDVPVAAASVGQVYKGYIEGYGDVAVKVQRPGLKELVESDAKVLRSVATFLESIPALPSFSSSALPENDDENVAHVGQQKLIATELVEGVNEFMSRVKEELDYRREADNAKRFANLYSINGGSEIESLPSGTGVIVPEIYTDFCTENVLIMEWIDGSKIVEDKRPNGQIGFHGNPVLEEEDFKRKKENLALIELGIQCTISQLLETGVMHADPHGGNLLRVEVPSHDIENRKFEKEGLKNAKLPGLAYLDFGLLAEVPEKVRDGLVCAVAQLVFARDVEAVASLFGELMLLPEHVLSDPVERQALNAALLTTIDEVLVIPDTSKSSTADSIPVLQFSKLINALTRLVPRFEFQLPPYFLNNARALGTLEGMARSIDPEFNVLRVLYPYALNRLLRNPSSSLVVFRTLQRLVTKSTIVTTKHSKKDELVEKQYLITDKEKISKLLNDASVLSGMSRRQLIWDVLKTYKGRNLIKRILMTDVKMRFKLRLKRLNIKRQSRKNSPSRFLKL